MEEHLTISLLLFFFSFGKAAFTVQLWSLNNVNSDLSWQKLWSASEYTKIRIRDGSVFPVL